MKHNKKRNTAFLYESLIKELTKSIVRKQNKEKNKIIEIIKKYFYKNSPLKRELGVYNILLKTENVSKEYALRLMYECRRDYDSLDRKKIFNLQTALIKDINESLSNAVFANFISNYRNIATVGQFFDSKQYSAKQRILIENKTSSILLSKPKKNKNMKHIDNLTYSTFVKKFNETYNRTLREEQKSLLTNYITSFSDNGLGLKSFMNEEIGRLKGQITESMLKSSIKNNPMRMQNTKKVLKKLESFSKVPISEEMVKDLFYIQDLAYEVNK
tara:strand:+ start:1368 stop:2183 length:816 start_codon:yes stop_codon:yes gene_type:complete